MKNIDFVANGHGAHRAMGHGVGPCLKAVEQNQ
jgi:hypothetical protein